MLRHGKPSAESQGRYLISPVTAIVRVEQVLNSCRSTCCSLSINSSVAVPRATHTHTHTHSHLAVKIVTSLANFLCAAARGRSAHQSTVLLVAVHRLLSIWVSGLGKSWKGKFAASPALYDLVLLCLVRLVLLVNPIIQTLPVPRDFNGVELHARHCFGVSPPTLFDDTSSLSHSTH